MSIALTSIVVGVQSSLRKKTTISYSLTLNQNREFMYVSVVHPGSRNDNTIVKIDEFLQRMKNKQILHDVEFELFRKDGTSFKVLGAYLITDNGYARWRMMQCPIKSGFNIFEMMWSTRLESVRKDVECTFGIFKVRFRILGGSVNFHDQWKVDNVFVANLWFLRYEWRISVLLRSFHGSHKLYVSS